MNLVVERQGRWKVFIAPTYKNVNVNKLFLNDENSCIAVTNPSDADFILVYGGDGAMIHAINHYLNKCSRFIGVNGGTIGFFMNENSSKILESNKFYFSELWMVDAFIDSGDSTKVITGLNEVRIERKTDQVLKMRLSIDGRLVPEVIMGDGMLASTPQGSTGYNQSARGKVIMPGVPVLQITPIAAKVNKIPLGSLILSDQSEVIITLEEQEKRPVRILADNTCFDVTELKKITFKKSEKTVEIGFEHDNAFLNKAFGAQYHF